MLGFISVSEKFPFYDVIRIVLLLFPSITCPSHNKDLRVVNEPVGDRCGSPRRRLYEPEATVVESNTFPHSAKGRFVVNNVDFTWCLALMTWKKRCEPC